MDNNNQKTTEDKIQDDEKPTAIQIKKVMEKIKIFLVMKQLREDNTPIEVIPNVYIGCLGAALNKKKLIEMNICYIVSVCEMPTNPFKEIFKCLVINVNDTVDQDIKTRFDESNEFIRKAVENKGNCLIHCFAGKSRSTSFIIAYLIKYHSMKPVDALQLIQSKRPIAQPNTGFLKQLEQYYGQLYQDDQYICI